MYPPNFEYYAPKSLDEAIRLLDQHPGGEAKVLAGGQSLIPLVNDHRLKSVACATNFRPGVGSPANAVLPTVRSAMGRSTSEFHPLPARSGKRPDSGRGIKGVSAPSLRRHGSPSLVHMPVGSRPSTVAPLRECLTSFEVFGGGRTLRRAYSFPSEGNSLDGMPVPSLRETRRCRRSSPNKTPGEIGCLMAAPRDPSAADRGDGRGRLPPFRRAGARRRGPGRARPRGG